MYESWKCLLSFTRRIFFLAVRSPKSAQNVLAQSLRICNEENPALASGGHFTRELAPDRIQFALVDFSTNNL